MAHQIIIENEELLHCKSSLGFIWKEIEVFNIDETLVGISIPTKILDSNDENKITSIVNSFRHYDMWEGKWNKEKNKH